MDKDFVEDPIEAEQVRHPIGSACNLEVWPARLCHHLVVRVDQLGKTIPGKRSRNG